MTTPQGWGSFKGFGAIQGRVQKDGTLRWEFKCKLYGTDLRFEARNLKDKEGKMVTNRQRNTVDKKEKTAALTICSIEVARKRSILGRSNALPILMSYT